MAMNMMGDAPAAGGNEAAPEGKPGYLLCIHVAGDGQISVGVEPDQDESSGMMADGGMSAGMGGMKGEGGESMEMDYKPVASIEEALSMARDIYRNNGKMPQNPDMAAAKQGYSKYAASRPKMTAPGGVFGEE